jgi:hypothetical protein
LFFKNTKFPLLDLPTLFFLVAKLRKFAKKTKKKLVRTQKLFFFEKPKLAEKWLKPES